MTALSRLPLRAPGGTRRDLVTLGAIALGVVTPVLVALGALPAVRGPFGVAFFLVVPGLALTSLLRLDDPVREMGLVFGVGLALLTLGAQVMVTVHAWNVVAATYVVAALSLVALVADVLPARRRRARALHTAPPAPGTPDGDARAPGMPSNASGATDPGPELWRSPVAQLAHDDAPDVVGNLARSTEPDRVLAAVSPPPRAGTGRRVDAEVIVHTVLVADAVVLWLASLGRLHVGGESGIGLVSALPVTYFLALATLTAGFGWAIASRRDNTVLLAAYTVALVLVLHATTAALYPEPRYAWVYKHLGVIRYISVHGSVNRDVDIYQNWPGFFALSAWFARVTGWSPQSFAAWAQPAFELLNVSALVFCFRGLTRDRRVVWCAVWIFLAANWLGQDYLSPQAFAFFEGMVVVGIVLRCARRDWSPAATRLDRAWARAVEWITARAGGEGAGRGRSAAPLAPVAALVCGAVCFASIVISHQLTPFVIVALVAALVVLRRARPVWLPFVMLGATLAWLGFAWPFVSSHFDLFSPAAVSTAHPSGFRSGHALPGVHVVDLAKVAIIAAVVVLAVVGLWLSRRRHSADVAVAALAAAPIIPAALQSYGGEGWLRALLFALPWLAFLAAPVCLELPRAAVARASDVRASDVRASWARMASIAIVSAVLLPLLLLAYFGQETVNYMSRSDVAVNEWYLRHAPDQSVVAFVAGNSPARLDSRYASMSVGDGSTTVTDLPGMDARSLRPADVARIADMLSSQRATARYLVSSPSQTRFLAYYGIVPTGWVRSLDDALLASPRFRVVDHDGSALVFQLVQPSPGARAPRT